MNIPRAEYDRIAAVNWSSLKHMAKSPAHYRHYLLNGRKDSPALKRGRAVHLAVLEPERFPVECVKWDGGTRRGKAWDAFSAQHAGREILTEDEWDECVAIAAAVRGDALASRYVSQGLSEVTVQWTVRGGITCKARLDFVSEHGGGAVVDLKTCQDAAPGAFGRNVVNYQLHAQAAWYSDAHEAVTGKRLPFVFVAVEAAAPYAVGVYRVPEDILDLGREHYSGLLERLETCRASNSWPSYSETEQLLTLPNWAMPREDEDDVTELGLTFGGV